MQGQGTHSYFSSTLLPYVSHLLLDPATSLLLTLPYTLALSNIEMNTYIIKYSVIAGSYTFVLTPARMYFLGTLSSTYFLFIPQTQLKWNLICEGFSEFPFSKPPKKSSIPLYAS